MSKYQEMLDYVKWYQEKYKDKDGNIPNPIFEIMLFEYPNKEITYPTSKGNVCSGWPDTGCVANMGFYYELDTAIQAMNENWCDIQEMCYYAGFIICRFPGIYNSVGCEGRIYFFWDNERQGFFEAEEPEIFKHIVY